MLYNYAPKKYSGKVTLFRSRETLKSNPIRDGRGWELLAAGGFEAHLIEADHNLLDKVYVKQVADLLAACMRKSIFDSENR